MRNFIKFASYLFHPVGMPLLGVIIYFLVSPEFYSKPIVKAKLLSLLILTVLVPFVFLFLLKNLGLINSIALKKVKERRLPLLFFCVLASVILTYVFQDFHFEVLHYFFIGVLYSGLTVFFLSLFKVKASLHLIGISGIVMFVIALSIFYQINLLPLIAFLIFGIGWTAASRKQSGAHRGLELVFGFFIGCLPQLILVQYWL